MRKLAMRLWSTRVAVIVARGTHPTPSGAPRIALSFSIMPSDQVDTGELDVSSTLGENALYVEGLARMYRHAPGDVIVARTTGGALVGLGLMSYADRHEALDATARGLRHRLSSDACWTEAHHVLPEFRNRGALAGLLEAERRHLLGRGIRTMHALIDSRNEASIRAFARAGYRPTGVIRRYTYRLNRFGTQTLVIDRRTKDLWQRAVTPEARR